MIPTFRLNEDYPCYGSEASAVSEIIEKYPELTHPEFEITKGELFFSSRNDKNY